MNACLCPLPSLRCMTVPFSSSLIYRAKWIEVNEKNVWGENDCPFFPLSHAPLHNAALCIPYAGMHEGRQ